MDSRSRSRPSGTCSRTTHLLDTNAFVALFNDTDRFVCVADSAARCERVTMCSPARRGGGERRSSRRTNGVRQGVAPEAGGLGEPSPPTVATNPRAELIRHTFGLTHPHRSRSFLTVHTADIVPSEPPAILTGAARERREGLKDQSARRTPCFDRTMSGPLVH